MYLEIENLTNSFGEKQVVAGLNLSLEQGKILCLLGSSGCGKTTTLRMLGGFLKPDAGRICLEGEEITALPPERRPLSTVFQSYALFPHLSVLKNVMYGLKYQGMAKARAVSRAREYLDVVGLSDRENASIQELSGGQQQRVALARALAVNPKVLLLDEPLSNLDAKLRLRMREELRDLQRKLQMTMIFVTHDQEEAMALADQIAIMDQGRLAQTGSPREVYSRPATPFVMEFLGTANRLPLPDGQAMWVRPEALRLLTQGEEPGEEEWLFTGQVVKGEYLGFYTQYVIRLEEGEILLRETFHDLAPGSQVALAVRRDAGLL